MTGYEKACFVNVFLLEFLVIEKLQLHCCGLDGPDGYRNTTLPNSCCPDNIRPCITRETKVYHSGCVSEMQHFLYGCAKVLGGIALGISLAEIIGAVFGLCLSSSIKNQYRRSLYA